MANEESKSPSASYPMVGGHGPTSYAQNSHYQKAVIDVSKELVSGSIMEKLDFKNSNFHVQNQFHIADYGCSIGLNTFFAVQNVIEAIKVRYHDQCPNNPPLEFQVYFSDHTENDFNALFKNLPPYKDYFAAGLPGSFHKQLLPKSFLHFVHCSYALHWLSTVPKVVTNNKSLAWNKDSIICSGFNKEVKKSFLSQFDNDLNKFLNARAKEIVANGLMVILIPSLPEGVKLSETKAGIIYECFHSTLMELAQNGLIPIEELYSFNLPIYYPTAKELEDIINKNGYFYIEKMEILDNPLLLIKSSPQIALTVTRSIFEGLVKMHFGDGIIVEKIFQHFAKKLEDIYSTFEKLTKRNIEHFIMLKRKINC